MSSPQRKLYKIDKISDLEATLGTRGFGSIFPDLLFHFSPVAEPLACAIHGVDVIQPKVGSEGEGIQYICVNSRRCANCLISPVLLLGAGPTG